MNTIYPTWVKEVLTPELEEKKVVKNGKLWLHPAQEKGKSITGNEIYQYLKDGDLLRSCVSAGTLQYYEKNPKKIPAEWKDKLIYGWKSVVRRDDSYLRVPCLHCSVETPFVDWYDLDGVWYDDEPALLFASTPSSDTKSSLTLSPLPSELERAIEICKEAGLTVTKTY